MTTDGTDVAPADDDETFTCFVKGLPYDTTEEQVREFFQKCCTKETKIQNIRMPVWRDSGRSRGFAFVDFPDEDSMDNAIDLGLSKPDFGGRWLEIREYTENPPAGSRRGRGRGRGRRGRGRGGGRGRGSPRQQPRNENKEDDSSQRVFTQDEQTMREVYIGNLSYEVTPEQVKDHFAKAGTVEDVTLPRFFDSGKPKGFAFVRFTEEAGVKKAIELDGSTLLGRPLTVQTNKGRSSTQRTGGGGGGGGQSVPRHDQPLSDKPEDCTTVFVGNLPWSTNDESLKQMFDSCGEIASARVITQRYTNRSRGFGYVEFADSSAVDAAVKLNGTSVEDRQIRVDYAQVKN